VDKKPEDRVFFNLACATLSLSLSLSLSLRITVQSINELKVNNKSLNEPSDISDILNRHFVSICPNLASALPIEMPTLNAT